MPEEEKTPEQLAKKEVNKRVAKVLADIEIKRRKYKAKIKKLDKLEKKILDGDVVPDDISVDKITDDDDDDDLSSSSSKHLVMLLDESGSMYSNKPDTINAINTYLKKLKTDKQINYHLTLTKFGSNNVETPIRNKPIKLVSFTDEDYHPMGGTPLYDAIGRTIGQLTNKKNVLFAIITDGCENMSQEYNLDSIKGLMRDKEKHGWTFIYLGADQDAWSRAKAFDMPKGNVIGYASANVNRTMGHLAMSTKQYSHAEKIGTIRGTQANFFSDFSSRTPKKTKKKMDLK